MLVKEQSYVDNCTLRHLKFQEGFVLSSLEGHFRRDFLHSPYFHEELQDQPSLLRCPLAQSISSWLLVLYGHADFHLFFEFDVATTAMFRLLMSFSFHFWEGALFFGGRGLLFITVSDGHRSLFCYLEAHYGATFSKFSKIVTGFARDRLSNLQGRIFLVCHKRALDALLLDKYSNM